jgi:arylsulfatase A-like enzyme
MLSAVAHSTESTAPNILLLVAEDMGARLGSYGDEHAKTPNLDALARQSTRFTQVYTTAGVCAPSRAALVTGQHQISFGAQHMRSSTAPLGRYLAQPPADLRALPELLRQLGYYTYTDGKLDYQFSGIRAGSGPFTLWDKEGESAEGWRERPEGKPFFALINLMQTHESGVMRADGKSYGQSHGISGTVGNRPCGPYPTALLP